MRVAIACQGGGSHTAFTAAALMRLLEDTADDDDVEVVALSGTSGGAVCAALAWSGLIAGRGGVGDARGHREAARRLAHFWTQGWPDGIAAHGYGDAMVRLLHNLQSGNWLEAGVPLMDRFRNDAIQFGGRLTTTPGAALRPEISPYLIAAMILASPLALSPWGELIRRETDAQEALRWLLGRHIDFDAARRSVEDDPSLPALLIGAIDVVDGSFKAFTSRAEPTRWQRDGITVDAVVASGAIPTLMRPVEIEGEDGQKRAYWNGLFSQNPPVHDLPDVYGTAPDRNPEQIWVIRINPPALVPPELGAAARVPIVVPEIMDRRNELTGNLSLHQELREIAKFNDLIDRDTLSASSKYSTVTICCFGMSDRAAAGLDHLDKLDRAPQIFRVLMDDGDQRAGEFLEAWRTADGRCPNAGCSATDLSCTRW